MYKFVDAFGSLRVWEFGGLGIEQVGKERKIGSIDRLLNENGERYIVVQARKAVRKGQIISNGAHEGRVIEVDYPHPGECVVDMDLEQVISNGLRKAIGEKLGKVDRFLEGKGGMQVYQVTQEILGENGREMRGFTIMEIFPMPFVFKGRSFLECLNKLILFIDTIGTRQLKKYSEKFGNSKGV